jgi:hypothetical protein
LAVVRPCITNDSTNGPPWEPSAPLGELNGRKVMNQKTTGDLRDRGADGRFQPGNPGNPNGRPKGSKNKATKLREELLSPILPEAIEKLREAVSEGERWAVEMAIAYSLPKPKPVDPDEIAEFEERLEHLEQLARKH